MLSMFNSYLNKLNFQNDLLILKKSNLMDPNWYLNNYKDIANSKTDPYLHYLKYGADENRDPGPDFSTRLYKLLHGELITPDTNPLIHYIKNNEIFYPDNIHPNNIILEELSLIEKSTLFDSCWYSNQYPEYIKYNLTALSHYYFYGAKENKLPRENFNIIVNSIKKVKFSTINPLVQYIYLSSNNSCLFSIPKHLNDLLWCGYSYYAVTLLQFIIDNNILGKKTRRNAVWYLVRWYYFKEDYLECSKYIDKYKKLGSDIGIKHIIAESLCLIRLKSYEKALDLINSSLKIYLNNVDLLFIKSTVIKNHELANSKDINKADKVQLIWLNKIFSLNSLSPVHIKNIKHQINLANIASNPKRLSTKNTFLVSVIMPLYNAESTINHAIDSLIYQSWENIELIIVDDCSTDNSPSIVKDYINKNFNIKLITNDHNKGTYLSRNIGLTHANGDYVMVHDCDDWSHPQKIEILLSEIHNKNSYVAAMSHWIRVDDNLEVIGPWSLKSTITDLDFSSLLIKKHVFDAIGHWPDVRISGDSEFKFRIEKYYGHNSIKIIDPNKILSLSLTMATSLTKSNSTHMKTLHSGVRWQYRDAFKFLHRKYNIKTNKKFIQTSLIPTHIRTNKPKILSYEYIFISDFSNYCSLFEKIINGLTSNAKRNDKIGIFHWKSFGRNVIKSLSDSTYETCINFKIDITTNSDTLNINSLIILKPSLILHKLDDLPDMVINNIYLLSNDDLEDHPSDIFGKTIHKITEDELFNLLNN